MSSGNPTRLFKRAFGIIYVGAAIIQFVISVGLAVLRFFASLFSALPWIFLLGALFFLSQLFFTFGFPIIEELEFIWRCELEPFYPNFFRPFFAALVEIWKEVCWWNLIGETQRLLSGKLIWDTLMHCENGFRFWDFIVDVMKSFVYLFKTYFKWFFVGNPVDDQLPIYPWYQSVAVLGVDLGNMITCLCADLRILVELFTRIVVSNDLLCALHQFTNALLDVLQTIVRFLIDVIKLFFDMVITHPGDLNYLVMKLSGEIPGFTIPSVVTATERGAVGAYYLGQFLDDALQILICTGISEVEAQGDLTMVDPLYAACIANNNTRADLFCWTGPLVGLAYRLERAVFQAIVNIPRILFELVTLPPGPRFLTDAWIVDEVYDTVRFPPPKYDYSSSINAPTLIVGSNASRIVPLQPDLYGNYSDPFNVSCVDYNVSRFIVPCQNCSEVEQYDLEECLCFLSRDVDRLIFDILDFKILDGTLCCAAGKLLRVITAVVKFIQGLASHIIVFDRFSEFVTDQNNWNTPIDELVGPYYQIGGLLSCCARILDGFNPKLECLCTLIVNLVKPIVEVIRILLESVVAALNDLFNTGGLGFFDVACTTEPTCFDLEVRVFQYLRRSRPNVINGTDPNYLDVYFPVNATAPPAWIDCFCDLISFQFLNQFLEHPVVHLPDFCCPLNTLFRFIVELVKFAVGLLFTVFETVASFFRPGPVQLTFLGYLACDTVESCAPISEMLSDVKDFLGCECLFVQSLDDIVNPKKINFPCLCDFFTAVANLVYDGLHGLALTAQTIVQLLDCITLGFPVGQDCGISDPMCVGSACDNRLLLRIEQLFLDFKTVTLDLADIVGTIGCVIGLLFRFDCLGTRYVSPPDWPVCSPGSSFGTCAMPDRLTRFFHDAFLVIIAIPGFVINIFKGLALVAFNFAFTGFTGLSDLVYQFLIALGNPFFGIPAHTDPNTGLPVPPTTGLFQSFCLLLNCLLGPATTACTNEAGPAIGADGSSACIGDALCVIGNILRDLWAAIALLISSLIGVIEALFSGNATLLGQSIVNFFKALIDILIVVLGNLENLLKAIIASIVGIVNALIPGLGSFIGFVLDVATALIQVLFIFLQFLLGGGMVMKRSTDVHSLPPEERSNLENEFKEASFSHAMFGSSPSSTIKDNYDKIVYYYAKHFKFMLFDKRPPSQPVGSNDENDDNVHHYYYDEDGRLAELRDAMKRSNEQSGSTDPPPSITFNDLRNMDFTTKTQTMFDKMTQGTYCKTAMQQFSSLDSFDALSLSEELIWKGCFVAYGLPIGLNAFYAPTTSNVRRSSQQDASNPGARVPNDVFYNPETFLNAATDVVSVLSEWMAWRLQYKSIMDEFPQDFVDITTIPDWFWAYEQQLYAASSNNNVTSGNGNKRYAHEPKKSRSPNKYVYHPDEIWERINENLLFINLPGEQLSIPVIDGRYPLYERNVTFAEHLIQKGLTSDVATNLARSLIFQDKVDLENSLLKIYATFDNMEKGIREQQAGSTDRYGDYLPNVTNYTGGYPWMPVNYPGSSFGVVWDKLFQMNARKTSQSTSSPPHDHANKKKRFDYFDPLEYVTTFYDSVSFVKARWNKLMGRKPPVDYKMETENLFDSKSTYDDGTVKRPLTEKEQNRVKRGKMVLESYGKTFEETMPRIKNIIEENVVPRVKSFDLGRYFFEVIPQTIAQTWGRLTGQIVIDDLMFELYVEKEYGDAIDLDDFKTSTLLDPKKRRLFSFDDDYTSTSNEDEGGKYRLPHPFVLTMDDLRREYEGKYHKDVVDLPTSRKRYVMQREPICNDPCGSSKKRNDDDVEMTIKERYGHVLQDDSLVGHRLKMLRNVTAMVYRTATNDLFSLDKMSYNLRTKYLNPYLKLYSDTIRVKKRSPTFYGLFSLFDRSLAVLDGGNRDPGHIFHEDSSLKRFMTYGDASYDTHLVLDDRRYDNSSSTELTLKRQSEIPIIPICLPGNAQLTCMTCDKCPTQECSHCQSCTNCTTLVGGAVECERCSVCSIGGPNCIMGCTGCETCAMEGVCLDCLIVQEFISSVIYFTRFCIALDNNDTSVIRKPLPNTSLVDVIFRNASNPTNFSDPILNFLFNTLIPLVTQVDIGATATSFVNNENQDPFEGSVGLLFFLRRWLPIPFLRQCNWDIDLQCTFGHGLEAGIVFATIVCVVLGILSWLVFPPLAGILSNFIVTAGWLVFWATLVMSYAWFYNPYCLLSPTSIVYSLLFPHFPILPSFPRCAAEQILAFLDKWIVPCSSFLQRVFFEPLIHNGTACPACPFKQNLPNCSDFGFTNQFTTAGFFLQRYAPGVSSYLNQTCLVRGGCFLGLGPTPGPLTIFFTSKFNVTFFPNGTPTNFTATLDVCGFANIVTSISTLLLALLVLFLLLPLIIDVLLALWIFLQRVLQIAPFSFLVVWPFNYLINPGGMGGWEPDGSYYYWDGNVNDKRAKYDENGNERVKIHTYRKKKKKKKKKDKDKDEDEKKNDDAKSQSKRKIKSSINATIDSTIDDDDGRSKRKTNVKRKRNATRNISSSSSDDSFDTDFTSSSSSGSDAGLVYEEDVDYELDSYIRRGTPTARRYVGFSGTVRYAMDGIAKLYTDERNERLKRQRKKGK